MSQNTMCVLAMIMNNDVLYLLQLRADCTTKKKCIIIKDEHT